MRLIDADALLNHLYNKQTERVDVALEIARFPNVDAVEVVHGRWDGGTKTFFTGTIVLGCYCSNCDNFSVRKSNYCPDCGAKMDGDGNEK